MILTVLFSLLFLAALYRYQTRPKIRRDGHKLRSAPDSLPLLGNAIKFLQPRHLLFDWFVQCQRQHGYETLEISVPTLPPGVVISDPTTLDFVLKNETSITKGSFFRERSWDLFGNGIINSSGDFWKAQRKAGIKFFSGSNMDSMIEDVLPDAYPKTRAFLHKAADTHTMVDMQQVFLDLTTSVVGQMAYDMDIDASSPFSKAFDYASDQIGLRFQNPLWWFTEIFTGAKLQESVGEIKKFGRQIVTNARNRRSRVAFESLITNDKIVFGSLIDSLIEAFNDPVVVADSALNFLSAGRDTTAQSFTWTLYALLRHPEALVRLEKDINTIKSLANDESPLTVADLQPNNIPYTMAVVYEALRLYPPVPFELKQCAIDISLPDGTCLPKSSIVVWCLWAMNRARQIWGDDADEFRPERWLDAENKLISKSVSEFPTFNGGPRSCLGKKMAELMAAYVLLSVLGEFEFQEVLSEHGLKKERITQNSLTLPMEGGLPCRVKRRGRTEKNARLDDNSGKSARVDDDEEC